MVGHKTNKIDLKAVFFCFNNIPYATVCTIIVLPEMILQNQEKAARSARKARLNEEPELGNVIRIRSQNGILKRRFPTGAHFQVRNCIYELKLT